MIRFDASNSTGNCDTAGLSFKLYHSTKTHIPACLIFVLVAIVQPAFSSQTSSTNADIQTLVQLTNRLNNIGNTNKLRKTLLQHLDKKLQPAAVEYLITNYSRQLLFKHRHNEVLADYYHRKGNWNLMAVHTALWLDDSKSKTKRTVAELVKDVKRGNWGGALKKTVSLINNNSFNEISRKMLTKLAAYTAIKTSSWSNAYYFSRRLLSKRTDLSRKEIYLLFGLALKSGNGLEAAYWGNTFREQFIKKSGSNHWILLNNLAWAHYMASQQVFVTNRRVQLKRALQYAEKAVRANRSFEALDTMTRILEKMKEYRKQINCLILMRALRPKDRSLIKRIRIAQRELKSTDAK